MTATKGELETHIRAVLATDEQSRNSDIRLTQVIWWKYHRQHLKVVDGKVYVDVNRMYELPREDNIKRIRAKIQNELHEYLPTSAEVAKKRHWNIEEWRSYLGYPAKGEPSRQAIASNADLDRQLADSLQKDDEKDEKTNPENQSLFGTESVDTPPTRRPNGYDFN